MFVWLKLLGFDDSKKLIEEQAVQAKVLLVPGIVFEPCPDAVGNTSPFVRASFSTASPQDIDTALSRLGQLLRGSA